MKHTAIKIESGHYHYRGYCIERYAGSYISWGFAIIGSGEMLDARDTLRDAMARIDQLID